MRSTSAARQTWTTWPLRGPHHEHVLPDLGCPWTTDATITNATLGGYTGGSANITSATFTMTGKEAIEFSLSVYLRLGHDGRHSRYTSKKMWMGPTLRTSTSCFSFTMPFLAHDVQKDVHRGC